MGTCVASIALMCLGLALTQQISLITALTSFSLGSCVSVMALYPMMACLRNLAEKSKKFANDPLTCFIYTGRTNEIGQLEYVQIFQNAKLRTAIGRVRESSSVLKQAAQSIATDNIDLSERTESQATSLEETSSSMQELTSVVQQNAQHAQHAKQLLQDARSKSVDSESIVLKTLDAMNEINASSKEIVDIINVIDGIAFQTNLLALNAAVESARAGEHGRGFAVVANEVRNLAGRSANSAKQIKALINDSAIKVETGAQLVHQSAESLKSINKSVGSIADFITDISRSSQEQSNGIEQVNQAVMHIDEVTQKNGQLVEKLAESSAAMTHKVKMLCGLVHQFKAENR